MDLNEVDPLALPRVIHITEGDDKGLCGPRLSGPEVGDEVPVDCIVCADLNRAFPG